MRHIAWDRGAVTEEAVAMIAIEFGVGYNQKTCKTQCEKRVRMYQIDNLMADCPECRAVVVEQAQAIIKTIEDFPNYCTGDWEKVYEWAKQEIERYGS